ncbi:MAG: DNA-processing protein DprA [Caldimonas sp.]
MDRDEAAAWVRLLETPGLGRGSARKLLAAFGSPQAVFSSSPSARREVVGAELASALAASSEDIERQIATTLAWLDTSAPEARTVITLGDPGYPAPLLQTADPPLLLYAQGHAELLQVESLAVVGSRNPTPQGAENARAFSTHLSSAGLVIVSGLALGIDAAAHEGGLDGGAGTIAVVGTGLDRVYPRRNRELAHRIATDGLIVSEFPLGTSPRSENFPIRNRIIAGLTRGTLVVEAALQSGSLITARLALEAGREVFAIPGSIHAPQARGCHALIKQGAKLVDRAEDVLEELRMPAPGSGGAGASAPTRDDPLLEALGYDPVTLDALIARTGRSAADLNIRLLELELEGRISRLPGQLFQRVARG